jgi:hypothetical protein
MGYQGVISREDHPEIWFFRNYITAKNISACWRAWDGLKPRKGEGIGIPRGGQQKLTKTLFDPLLAFVLSVYTVSPWGHTENA